MDAQEQGTSMDGQADICSCNICTSTIPGSRMQQGAMDGGAATKLRKVVRYSLPLGMSSSAIAPALL